MSLDPQTVSPGSVGGNVGRGSAATGIAAVAATYVFFLLWAQYGFLDLLRARLAGAGEVRIAMAAMGIAGLGASLGIGALLGRLERRPGGAGTVLPTGFLACAAVAPAGLAAHGLPALTVVAATVGAATALVTVPLAAGLRRRLPGRRFGLAVGTGTGVAYLVCNLPPLFEGPPAHQAAFVATVCLAAAWLTRPARGASPGEEGDGAPPLLPEAAFRGTGFAAVVVAFLALVWLDSAAFAIIQESAALKATTWEGAGHSLLQGAVHLSAALLAGWAVDRGRLVLLPPAAFVLFLVAFPVLSGGGSWSAVAGPLYAAGISLYSVALVAYPAAGGDAPGRVPRRWRAAILFGIAGWLGSALGVGMAQDLHRIPAAFLVAAAAALALAAWLARRRRDSRGPASDRGPAVAAAGSRSPGDGRGRAALGLLVVPMLFAVAALLLQLAATPRPPAARSGNDGLPPPPGAFDPAAVARGRAVYRAEGCVHCHSQYVRPIPRDVEMWGPYRTLDRTQRPPLVGNRRQGPDLQNVGNRRSPEWQRLHLRDPRSLVPGSRMPSYAHLFAPGDGRGDDLVAYLSSLGGDTTLERWQTTSRWPHRELPEGSAVRGGGLFATWCAACHGDRGRGDGALAPALTADRSRPGLDLAAGGLAGGSFQLVPWSGDVRTADAGQRRELDRHLARLIRFGAVGSPMAGHEWLTLQEVSDLVSYLHTLPGDGAPTDDAVATLGDDDPRGRPGASPRSRRPRPSLRTLALVTLPTVALLGIALTGWTAPPRPWTRSTGWDRVPPEQRAPVAATPWEPGGEAGPPPRLTWLGHAGFLVEWEDTRLLIDPNSSTRCTVARRVMAERVDPASLGPVDAALISHAHYDHLDLPTLAAVPDLGVVVLPRGSEGYLAGLPPTVERVGLAAGEAWRVGGLEVVAVPARHNGNRFHPLASEQAALGYVIRSPRATLFVAGDTGYGPHLAAVGAAYHPRAAILPIGAFAPRIPLRRYHLSPEEAVRAAADLGAEVVIPYHFGTFPLSLDPPAIALPRFAAAAARAGQRWVMPALPGAEGTP